MRHSSLAHLVIHDSSVDARVNDSSVGLVSRAMRERAVAHPSPSRRRVRFVDDEDDDEWMTLANNPNSTMTRAPSTTTDADADADAARAIETTMTRDAPVPMATPTPRETTPRETTSSAVKERIAAFERARVDDASDASARAPSSSRARERSWSSTPPAPRFEVAAPATVDGSSPRTPASAASTSSRASASSASRAVERVTEDVRAVRVALFESSVAAVAAVDAEVASWEASARAGRTAPATTRVDDEDADSRDRARRVTRRAGSDLETLRRTHDAREARVTERRRRWMETETRESRRFGVGVARRRSTSSASSGPVFLTGVPASSSKHANYVDERASRARDDGESLLKLAAFTALRNHAERNRAARSAANDLGMIRRAPILRRAFEGLRSHAVACAPRTRAMLEACETFVAATNRRVRRETLRRWRRATKDASLERTCAAIHNVRCAHAALCHWELFAARAFWKRRARELATRYADGRLKIYAFYGWARHARRANERRIAVRARMFGMSALEAKRAIHQTRDRTAADAREAMELAARELFETTCLRGALRAQVTTSATLVRTLLAARRFTATDDDVVWASTASARVRGVGTMRRHKSAGLGARIVDETRRDALARDRDDVVASRTAATIEEEEATRSMGMMTVDVDALSADAYETALEHQKSLRDAREATRRCVDARSALHETTVAASRLTANADARANAAMQGARDAVEEADKAERLVIEAECAADVAEKRAEALAASGAHRDDADVTEAFGLAADAATRAVALSSAHVAAARVAERATRVAEEHAAARELVAARAAEEIEEAKERVRDAEALVMTTAKIERELKVRALDASKLLRRVVGPSAGVAYDDRNVFVRRERDDVVFSPTKTRSADEKKDARQRATWESFGDGDDDDDDDVRDAFIDTRGMSLRPGEWHTLAQCAAQAHGKRLAMKTFRGFASHVVWRRRQREASQLAFVTNVFTSWACRARENQTRRKLIERVVDEVVEADRARRLGAYVACFRAHAKWRRARSEELSISLRRVVEPTITRPAFQHWRRKVSNIFLARRVISAAIDAWRRRLAKPAYASDFYCAYDAFHAWRSLTRERRVARRRRQTAVEYRRVSLALKTLRVWRRAARRRRDRHHRVHRILHHRRLERERRFARRVLSLWRVEASRRRRLARCVETRLRRLALGVLLAWRAAARAAVITRTTTTARASPVRDVPWRPFSPSTRVR